MRKPPRTPGPASATRAALQPLRTHPHLYQINTWPWLDALSATAGRSIRLVDVPDAEWDRLAELGFDCVYLLGIWKRSIAGRRMFRSDPAACARFDHALPGWTVESAFDKTAAEIGHAVSAQWFAVAGLTVGSERSFPSLVETIGQIRRNSRNQMISVMVGGPLFTANPELAIEVGADGTAVSAPSAVLMAQKLFDVMVLKTAN